MGPVIGRAAKAEVMKRQMDLPARDDLDNRGAFLRAL
jgi:hypothetical protein